MLVRMDGISFRKLNSKKRTASFSLYELLVVYRWLSYECHCSQGSKLATTFGKQEKIETVEAVERLFSATPACQKCSCHFHLENLQKVVACHKIGTDLSSNPNPLEQLLRCASCSALWEKVGGWYVGPNVLPITGGLPKKKIQIHGPLGTKKKVRKIPEALRLWPDVFPVPLRLSTLHRWKNWRIRFDQANPLRFQQIRVRNHGNNLLKINFACDFQIPKINDLAKVKRIS